MDDALMLPGSVRVGPVVVYSLYLHSISLCHETSQSKQITIENDRESVRSTRNAPFSKISIDVENN